MAMTRMRSAMWALTITLIPAAASTVSILSGAAIFSRMARSALSLLSFILPPRK